MYVNNVVLVGNLTCDPCLSENESVKASFRIAASRWRKPGDEGSDEIKERTEFVDVECWGSQATNVAASLHRGDRAIVAGQIKYEQWEDEGIFHSRVRAKAQAIGRSLEFQSCS